LDAVFSVPVAILGMVIFIFLFMGPLRRKEPIDAIVESK
jgi:hypothetical protein